MFTHDNPDSALCTEVHRILSRIRRLKTFVNLADVYNELLQFFNLQDSKMREMDTRPDTSSVLSSNLSILDRINFCSVLAAAFSRRARVLMHTKGAMMNADAVGLVSLTGGDTTLQMNISQVLTWVHHLEELLKNISSSSAIVQALRIELSHNDYFSHQDRTFWSLEASLSYGHGELHDIETEQYVKNIKKLNTLLLKARPDMDMITEVVKDLSELRYDEAKPIFKLFQGGGPEGQLDVDVALKTTLVVTHLRDLISQDCIQLPARGIKCAHFEVFDLGSFVRMVMQRRMAIPMNNHHAGDWGAPCPVCSYFTALVDLRVDRTVLNAIRAYTQEKNGKIVPLTANHALMWDLEKRTCRVIEDDNSDHARAHEDNSEIGVFLEDHEQDDQNDGIHKKRRVEIDGHVLYVDE
ncbi:unnamed protein product [Phytomonas sp. Hart1]|nr:unnamed protein product [Phytomonas sp. Hart1]|eukprot:CCW67281.1 unnamed protein product [Phytomonas sp. isolate Hart1]